MAVHAFAAAGVGELVREVDVGVAERFTKEAADVLFLLPHVFLLLAIIAERGVLILVLVNRRLAMMRGISSGSARRWHRSGSIIQSVCIGLEFRGGGRSVLLSGTLCRLSSRAPILHGRGGHHPTLNRRSVD